jgi:integrase/recombinase XerD
VLNLWRRHSKSKCNLRGRQERRCRCPIWISGVDAAGNRIKETTKLRDWTRAEALARHWDARGAKPTETARTTIDELETAFLAYAANPAGKNLKPPTIVKYKQLFKQLSAFAADTGYRYISQLDLEVLTEFVSTWKDKPLSASKKLKRLRTVLKFAVRRKWITENPALDLDVPKIPPKATMPFSPEEMKNILKAATGETRVFIQTMLYSGLRIMDTAMLTADSVKGDRIQLRQAKTGEPVSVLVPHEVAEALRSLPRRPHFFWAGKATPTNTAASWGVRLSAVFKKAGIHNGHSHRLRDTFAVRLLTAGVSLENVSTLLGHTSIRTTEEFYSPWIKVRQDALDREVSRAMQDYP